MLYTVIVVELPTASENALYPDCEGGGPDHEGCVVRIKFPELCKGRNRDEFSKRYRPPDCPLPGHETSDIINQRVS